MIGVTLKKCLVNNINKGQDKMSKSILERLMGGVKNKASSNQQVLEETVKQKLKGIVYDDELIAELTPTFVKLYSVEGFSTVVELLEAKEKQIETISGGDWFKQETDPQNKDQQDNTQQENESDPVDDLLKTKYKD